MVSRADPPEKPLSQSYLSWGDMVEAIAQEGHGAADRDKVLTAADYQQAEMTIFQIVQVEFFPEKIRLLKAGKAVFRSSRLFTLSPELDPGEGIIQVGGRLQHAEGLDPTFNHPIVLDPLHPATKRLLLIQDYDARLCHPVDGP